MPTPRKPDSFYQEVVEHRARFGTTQEAANDRGIPRLTLCSQLAEAAARGIAPAPVPTADPLPEKRLPIEEVIEQKERAFERRHAHNKAKVWRKFAVPTRGPYALMFFGDPHLDDDGCNLPLFKAHASLAAATEHLYAINIGDSTNNWAGRLARLWADQDASAETAREIVKHYMVGSGIPWFLWLHGKTGEWAR